MGRKLLRFGGAAKGLEEQGAFLEDLAAAASAIAALRHETEILARLAEEAKRLFHAHGTGYAGLSDRSSVENAIEDGKLRLPLTVRDEAIATLELTRSEPFTPLDAMRARLLADFAGRAVENARLLADARQRETERARLAEQLITAEQDERRRLSIFLHDGPLQSMSGIALMHDAALAAIGDGRYDDAERVVRSSLERERATIRSLRDLTFAIEPLVLRDHGLVAAVRALGEQVERSERITVSADVDAGERLAERAQVALYQVIREALTQAVRRQPNEVRISVAELEDGRFAAEVADDGMGERRRSSVESIDERVRVLNGRLAVENLDEGGTVVRVTLPPYVAAASS